MTPSERKRFYKKKNKFKGEIFKTKILSRTILMNIKIIRLQRNLVYNNTNIEMIFNTVQQF
jgi:hypothetical protein